MATYLGIDYGTKKIGLAWADELGGSSFGTIPELNLMIAGMNLNGWSKREKREDEFVVGYPIHMDGEMWEKSQGS